VVAVCAPSGEPMTGLTAKEANPTPSPATTWRLVILFLSSIVVFFYLMKQVSLKTEFVFNDAIKMPMEMEYNTHLLFR
jgi:hypothetical protein